MVKNIFIFIMEMEYVKGTSFLGYQACSWTSSLVSNYQYMFLLTDSVVESVQAVEVIENAD